ncbi:MAG TPA: hypothetical protein VGD46_18645 [Rhizobacter sp.]
MKKILALLCMGVASGAWAAPTIKAITEDIVHTKFATVQAVSSHGGMADKLKVKNTIVFPVNGAEPTSNVFLSHVIEADDRVLVLFSEYGGTACPATYHWVLLNATQFAVTDPFGTCSELSRIEIQGDHVVITIPEYRTKLRSGKTKQYRHKLLAKPTH